MSSEIEKKTLAHTVRRICLPDLKYTRTNFVAWIHESNPPYPFCSLTSL
jgi:hypothetical protein